MLVSSRLGGRVGGQDDALPLRRVRGEVDDPRPLRLTQQRQRRPHAVHHAHHAVVEGLPPLFVGELLECSPRPGPDGVDEDVELAVPPLTDFVEHALDSRGVRDVGHQPDGIRTSPSRQLSAARSRTSWVRPTTATRAPSSARQRAAANPIPRPPPTTTAVASFSPRSTLTLHLSPEFARKAYYRSYSRRARRWRAPSTGWFPVRLTVTAGQRHACEDAVQTVAAGRFKPTKL